jgi:phosphoglycolate phosphatase-like HAD superfamily hydrolase
VPTVLFDIDGTLLRFKGLGRQAMGRAMEEVWGLRDPLREISFVGGTDSAVARRVGKGLDREAMWRRYVAILSELVDAHDDLEPLPGVIALLDRLRDGGARLGLLTGNIRGGAKIKLEAVGLLDRFDLSLSAFAEDGERREEVAEAARHRCGDGAIWIVGDSINDIRCARHVGAPVLVVTTGPQSRELLDGGRPDRLVDDLSATDEIADWLLAPR